MFDVSKNTNQIDTITIPDLPGVLGLVACPGIRLDDSTSKRGIGRHVRRDLNEILRWKANGVVTLLEERELVRLQLRELPELIEKHGLWWRYLPIRDMYVPDDRFELSWEVEGERLRRLLVNGERIIVHCLAGLGRTGMIAARILVELGMDPAEAILRVREPNRCRIQTELQYNFVRACQPVLPPPNLSN